MTQESPKADCPKHGIRDLTFACIHIAEAIDSGEKVGFFWSAAEGNLPPIAWCGACENWLLQHGEEWNDAFMAEANFKPLCADCFDLARKVV